MAGFSLASIASESGVGPTILAKTIQEKAFEKARADALAEAKDEGASNDGDDDDGEGAFIDPKKDGSTRQSRGKMNKAADASASAVATQDPERVSWEKQARIESGELTWDERGVVNVIMNAIAYSLRFALTGKAHSPYAKGMQHTIPVWIAWITNNKTCRIALDGKECLDFSCARTRSHECVLCTIVASKRDNFEVEGAHWPMAKDRDGNFWCPVMDILSKGTGRADNDYDMLYRAMHFQDLSAYEGVDGWFAEDATRDDVLPKIFRVQKQAPKPKPKPGARRTT